jgi:excisionase family DNA binding protein
MLELTKALYRPTDAARVLKISRATIYRFIDSGRLLPIHDALGHWKIPREQLTNIRLGIQ